MASLASQPLRWDEKIAALKDTIAGGSQIMISNLLRNFRYDDNEMRRVFCSSIGTELQVNGQPHEATPIFNFLIYKGYFDVVDRYIGLFPVSKFNEPTGVGGLRNPRTRENIFHIAARSHQRSHNRLVAIGKVINRYTYSVSDRNLLTEALAVLSDTDIEATPLMTLLGKVLDMWSAIQRSSSGRRVTGVNFNTLKDEYNLIKFMITQNNSVERFFNVSMTESMNWDSQDMYDGYRGDFENMERRFDELTGIGGMLRLKLENSGYYDVSEEDESDTSTQILSESDDDGPDSYDENDDYFADNADYRWNEETEHWESADEEEEVWTRPSLEQDLHDRLNYASERRQQDVLIQLIRYEGNRVLYAYRYGDLNAIPYFNWFIYKGLDEVVTFAIGQLDDGGDMVSDRLTSEVTRWNPYHYAATSVRFDRLLNSVNLLNQNLSVVRYSAAHTVTYQGDTPLMILLKRIPDGYEDAIDTEGHDERTEMLDDTLNLYDKIKQWMQGEGQRFVQASFNRVTPEVATKYGNIATALISFEYDIQEYFDPDFEDNKLSDMIDYTVQQTAQQPVARNLANELNRVAPRPARLGEIYTLNEFRTIGFPVEEDRLTFTVPGKDLDCDVGDYETTKYMPVKLDVERSRPTTGQWISRHNWDVDGSGKLYLFCAQDLRQYLTTRQGTYGLSVDNSDTFFENRMSDTNPFNRKKILGVQYLTREEIEAEEAKYPQLKSENSSVEANRKKLEQEADKETYKQSMNLLSNNSMLSILRRRLTSARNLLAEERAKDPSGMSNREREARHEEIVGAQNRILNLEQMIRREEQKEEQKRLEESKRKNLSSDGGSNKRQRRKLFLKFSNLKF